MKTALKMSFANELQYCLRGGEWLLQGAPLVSTAQPLSPKWGTQVAFSSPSNKTNEGDIQHA